MRLLVVEAQKKAVVEALESAKEDAEFALIKPAENLVSAQEKLTQEQTNLSEKEAQLETAKSALADDPLSAAASANVDLAQAAVDWPASFQIMQNLN